MPTPPILSSERLSKWWRWDSSADQGALIQNGWCNGIPAYAAALAVLQEATAKACQPDDRKPLGRVHRSRSRGHSHPRAGQLHVETLFYPPFRVLAGANLPVASANQQQTAKAPRFGQFCVRLPCTGGTNGNGR